MKISFCTTCFNRRPQLRQVFAANTAIVALQPDIEWCIVDLGSVDGLDDFMREALPATCERVRYIKELSSHDWHVSVAKNIAHRQGNGEILVNLDCDSFIGDTVELVWRYFRYGCKVLHMWSGELGDGTCGRIAIARSTFHALGGHDESLFPMGYQDLDLLRRAMASGFSMERADCDGRLAIKNGKDESVRHCARGGMRWSRPKESECALTPLAAAPLAAAHFEK